MSSNGIRAILGFLAIAFGLSWLVALPLWLSGEGLATWGGLGVPILGAVMMCTPAIAALVACLAIERPVRGTRLHTLGISSGVSARRVIGYLALGIVVPVALILVALPIGAALGVYPADFAGLSGFRALVDAQLSAAGVGELPIPFEVLVALQFVQVFLGVGITLIPALGEELGWRGWLQTALRPLGVWPALLLTGAIWGLWHAPVILLGYNFGRPDVVGLLLMVGGCLAWGVLLGWMRLRCASVWPAVLAHGSLNAVAGAVLLLSFYVNGASFLAFAAIAEKRGLTREAHGRRSFLFTTGLAEATETILFFAAFCLFPAWFAVLACVFAAATFWTAGARVILAWRTFRP